MSHSVLRTCSLSSSSPDPLRSGAKQGFVETLAPIESKNTPSRSDAVTRQPSNVDPRGPVIPNLPHRYIDHDCMRSGKRPGNMPRVLTRLRESGAIFSWRVFLKGLSPIRQSQGAQIQKEQTFGNSRIPSEYTL